ncbi:hypothetical protein OAF00_01500 [bacterium]|nr:hypothetical protein [bacterium]MDA7680043.1 hypothetical protein [bacterium]MDB4681223.1 hypothetical protein [bacterium]MDC0309695.1 hypothetical protein [bacterium]
MSPTKKTLIEIVFGSKRRFIAGFGGMVVMVVTTVCGIMVALDDSLPYSGAFHAIYGGAIGAVVGGLLWGLLGYMVYRKKNAPPNEIIPDDTTT